MGEDLMCQNEFQAKLVSRLLWKWLVYSPSKWIKLTIKPRRFLEVFYLMRPQINLLGFVQTLQSNQEGLLGSCVSMKACNKLSGFLCGLSNQTRKVYSRSRSWIKVCNKPSWFSANSSIKQEGLFKELFLNESHRKTFLVSCAGSPIKPGRFINDIPREQF